MPEEIVQGRKRFRVTDSDERDMLDDARLYCGSARELFVKLGRRNSQYTGKNFSIYYNGAICLSLMEWGVVEECARLRREAKKDYE